MTVRRHESATGSISQVTLDVPSATAWSHVKQGCAATGGSQRRCLGALYGDVHLTRAQLLDDLLDGQPHSLAAALDTWLLSRRYQKFVSDHLPKIRKKLRGARDPDSARDLLLELEVAYRLTRDKRFSVTYEPVPGGKSRGPDFGVQFTTSVEFMVEVTRLRGLTADAPAVVDHGVEARRLASVLALKSGQTVADRANLLVIGTDTIAPEGDELATMMKEVRHDAETTDPEALLKRGFRHRGEYLRRLERVSAILVRRAPSLEGELGELVSATWLNPHARTRLPSGVQTTVSNLLDEG